MKFLKPALKTSSIQLSTLIFVLVHVDFKWFYFEKFNALTYKDEYLVMRVPEQHWNSHSLEKHEGRRQIRTRSAK